MKTQSPTVQIGSKASHALMMMLVIFIGMILSLGTAEAKDNSRLTKRNASEVRKQNKKYVHACAKLKAKRNELPRTREKHAKWR
jgi:hypothetical protein